MLWKNNNIKDILYTFFVQVWHNVLSTYQEPFMGVLNCKINSYQGLHEEQEIRLSDIGKINNAS